MSTSTARRRWRSPRSSCRQRIEIRPPGQADLALLYTCPDPDPRRRSRWPDEKGACIVELRLGGGGKGAQSVMPGSVHPSGERYEWEADGERATVKCAELKAAVVKIAVGAIADPALARPGRPARNGAGARRASCPGGMDRGRRSSTSSPPSARRTAKPTDPEAHGKTARDSAEHARRRRRTCTACRR